MTIVISPLLTRIYTPEEYGILAIYTSIVSLLAFGTFKYEYAIPKAKDEDEAYHIFTLSIILSIIFSILIFVPFYIFSDYLSKSLSLNNSYVIAFTVPIGLLLLMFFRTLRQLSFRNRTYKLNSRAIVSQSLVGNTLKLLLGLFGFGQLGLIIGKMGADSLGSVPFYLYYKNMLRSKKLKFNKLKCVANKYIDFAKYQTPT